MSLTVKHINSDASFLLTFQSHQSSPSSSGSRSTFTVLLDPWLSGSAVTGYSWFSTCKHIKPSCVSSLKELEVPDLVVISQNKNDHCHEATLKDLPSGGLKPQIVAEPGAANTIRSWNHFDPRKIITLHPFHPRRTAMCINRFTVPSTLPDDSPGQVTVCLFAQSYDMTGLHTAIGFTYRPPSTGASDMSSPSSTTTTTSTVSSSPDSHPSERSLSVIFSPHGCNYKTIRPWVDLHLVPENALPLTALLHPFDRLTNPFFLGGVVVAGLPGGKEIAQSTHAQVWISAHDGDMESTGFAVRFLSKEKYEIEDVEDEVGPQSTQVLTLGIGKEVTLGREMTEQSLKSEEGP